MTAVTAQQEVTQSDIELLTAWRMGDMRAAKTVYRRHFGAICRFFRNKLSNLEEVADLVGDTFLELLKSRNRPSWDDSSIVSLRYYLLGIARNVLYARFRDAPALHCHGFSAERLDQLSLEQLSPRSLSSIIGGRREVDILIKALRRLPLGDQILLEAKYFEYVPDSALAALVEVAASTLPGRLRGARNRLIAEIARLSGNRGEIADPGPAMEQWIAELRKLIMRTNPRGESDA